MCNRNPTLDDLGYAKNSNYLYIKVVDRENALNNNNYSNNYSNNNNDSILLSSISFQLFSSVLITNTLRHKSHKWIIDDDDDGDDIISILKEQWCNHYYYRMLKLNHKGERDKKIADSKMRRTKPSKKHRNG